jgi:ethanolamine-phosphate cytidylyltransferase
MEKIDFNKLDYEMIKLIKSYNLVKSNKTLLDLVEKYSLNQESSNYHFTLENELSKIMENLLRNIQPIPSPYDIQNIVPDTSPKKIRVYMDGVFDIIHSGHFNAIRQGKKFGHILVVGVNSDADVEKAKGPTLMNIHERAELIRACKWVDEVVIDTPYTPTIPLLDSLNVDYCCHGDDPCFNENGEDAYGEMKKANRFKVFKRTEGISTTEIIGRLLALSKSTLLPLQKPINSEAISTIDLLNQPEDEIFKKGPVVSAFLTTGCRLQEFCNNRFPKENDKIVYIDGAFDILHGGHVETLKKAKELGSYLLVGVHDDATVNKYRGKNYPILNLQERVINLLSMKYVDDVIIGAPWIITSDLIKSLNINLVVQGTETKFNNKDDIFENSEDDPYNVPKKMGIYQKILSTTELTNDVLINRLIERRERYVKKYENKSKKEEEYYKNKDFIKEV